MYAEGGCATDLNNKGYEADQKGDHATALKWWRKAADREGGDGMAESNLGVYYENGRGVPVDLAEAARWFRKSAEKGNQRGMFYFGWVSEFGRGVPQDYAEAAKWYEKATLANRTSAHELERARAHLQLAKLYAVGKQGVRQDYLVAYAYLMQGLVVLPDSARGGQEVKDKIVKNIVEVSRHLSETQKKLVDDSLIPYGEYERILVGNNVDVLPFDVYVRLASQDGYGANWGPVSLGPLQYEPSESQSVTSSNSENLMLGLTAAAGVMQAIQAGKQGMPAGSMSPGAGLGGVGARSGASGGLMHEEGLNPVANPYGAEADLGGLGGGTGFGSAPASAPGNSGNGGRCSSQAIEARDRQVTSECDAIAARYQAEESRLIRESGKNCQGIKCSKEYDRRLRQVREERRRAQEACAARYSNECDRPTPSTR